MTSTEIAVRDTAAVSERDIVDGWVSVVRDVGNLADYIAETDFVPKALRNRPAAVAACILTGRELGIGPMASLKSIHMVQGVPSLSAEYKRARALAAGHEIVVDESNASRCVIRGRRSGTERWVTITWTVDMARRAKLAGKDVWQQYPQRMLQARASSELCDLLFPDASLGLETTEVLADGGIATVDGRMIDAATGEIASGTPDVPAAESPKSRTAQRRQRAPKDASPAQAATNPAPASPPVRQGAGEALPPLPGEEDAGPTGAASATATDSTAAPASGQPAPPDDTDYDTPGTVSDAQLKAIWTVLGQVFHFGADEKDQARQVCAHIAGHELESSKDLSHNEARAVLDTLAHWQQQAGNHGEDPRAWMLTVMAEGEKDA